MSADNAHIDERDLRAIAALADGTLRGRRRRAAEARVRARPELAALLAEQQAALRAVHALDVRAPARLRMALAQPSGSHLESRRPRRLALGLGLAAGAATALVLALTLPGGTPGAPSLVQAAEVGLRPATEAPPARDRGRPGFLRRSFGGVAYPDWGPGYGWRATGARVDRVGGRRVVTVFYANRRGHRLAYAIVGGKTLAVPAGTETTYRTHKPFRSLSRGSRTVVTWERAGHTCILVSSHASSETMVRLAAYEGLRGQYRY